MIGVQFYPPLLVSYSFLIFSNTFVSFLNVFYVFLLYYCSISFVVIVVAALCT